MVHMTDQEKAFCEFWRKERTPRPPYEGRIAMGSRDEPIRYRIGTCIDSPYSHQDIDKLAFRASRLTCLVIDVIRDRLPAALLGDVLHPDCIPKLATMRFHLGDRLNHGHDQYARIVYPPAEPQFINGMLLSETRIEMSIGLHVGGRQFCGSIIFERMGAKWICVYIDIG